MVAVTRIKMYSKVVSYMKFEIIILSLKTPSNIKSEFVVKCRITGTRIRISGSR